MRMEHKRNLLLKQLAIAAVFVTTVTFSLPIASAADTDPCKEPDATSGIWAGVKPGCLQAPPGLGANIAKVINNVIPILTAIGLSVAVLFMVLGGFQYITAAGNPDQMQKAKMTLLYSVVGLILILLSYAVIKFFTSSLGS